MFWIWFFLGITSASIALTVGLIVSSYFHEFMSYEYWEMVTKIAVLIILIAIFLIKLFIKSGHIKIENIEEIKPP